MCSFCLIAFCVFVWSFCSTLLLCHIYTFKYLFYFYLFSHLADAFVQI